MNDPSLITYHDVTLHSSDIQLLNAPNWLNDNLISFYFEYLTYEVFKDHQEDLLFVHPGTIFMISFQEKPEDIREVVAPLKMERKKLIFMPINNNRDISSGGSHWALLVYSRLTNKFSYYDSFSGYNFQPARETANKIWKILDCPTKPSFEEVRTPQQKNGFDCGLYCISISEYLGNNYLNRSNESLEKVVTPESINDLRTKIKNIIELKKKIIEIQK